jgi:hypothetical protein
MTARARRHAADQEGQFRLPELFISPTLAGGLNSGNKYIAVSESVFGETQGDGLQSFRRPVAHAVALDGNAQTAEVMAVKIAEALNAWDAEDGHFTPEPPVWTTISPSQNLKFKFPPNTNRLLIGVQVEGATHLLGVFQERELYKKALRDMLEPYPGGMLFALPLNSEYGMVIPSPEE